MSRFEAGEEKRDEALCKKLASYCDVYVNDAFGTAHRSHASTAAIVEYGLVKTAVCGFLIEKELSVMADSLDNPNHPFVAILGGAKVSDKIGVINSLLEKVDTLLIGGAMAYTFLKALGKKTGDSPVEDDQLEYALNCYKSGKIVLPVDNVEADGFDEYTCKKVVEGDIDEGFQGLDIGPKTVELYAKEIATAKVIFWNGPMGVFEKEDFVQGTIGVCEAIAKNKDCFSVIGGGDSAAAAKQFGFKEQFSHVSTGGGASLEMIELDGHLPGIDIIG